MKRLLVYLAFLVVLLAAGPAAAEDLPAESIYWKQIDDPLLPDAGQSVVEPEAILLVTGNCDGCGYRIINLKWKGWGSETAVGTGKVMPLLGGSGDPNAKVFLTNPRRTCGEPRYMGIRTAFQGYSNRYPDVDCQGKPKHPEPTPPPRRKPKLKLRTAKAVFQKTSAQGGRLRSFKKQSVRCGRVARTRVRCRGRWIYRGTDANGVKFSWRYKGSGWVKKRGRYYTSKVVLRLRVTSPDDSFTSPPETERGYYVVR